MSKIIFLNGCGSSGKTSLTRSIQNLSEDFWLAFAGDIFCYMLAENKADQYYRFVPGENDHGPTMAVEVTPKGRNYFDIMPVFVELLADKGHNIIIDEVLLSDDILLNYVKRLTDQTVYFVSVVCDLQEMQKREKFRGDRHIGLSNHQIGHVHLGLRSVTDLSVDTSNISPEHAARQILDYINITPNPGAFNRIRAELIK